MSPESLPPVVDIPAALDRLGGDQQLLSDMIGFCAEDAPQLLHSLHTAIDEQNAMAARRAAHKLKGLILSCGGVRAARSAQAVEDMAETGDLGEIAPLVDSLSDEVAILVEATLPYRTMRTTESSRQAHSHH